MKIKCIIPARLQSKRLANKVLLPLGEYTLLGNVIEAAKSVSAFDEVIVAACGEKVADVAKEHGVKVVLTDPAAPNGTMRIIEAVEKERLDGDIFVNWQADEPFVCKEVIASLLDQDKDADVWTLKKRIDAKEAENPSVVKVVTDSSGRAMYFSRAKIPFVREEPVEYFKHIGMYAFAKEALLKIQSLQETPLEKAENLEQLRWLENGMHISVMEISKEVIGIDTHEDLQKANTLV